MYQQNIYNCDTSYIFQEAAQHSVFVELHKIILKRIQNRFHWFRLELCYISELYKKHVIPIYVTAFNKTVN